MQTRAEALAAIKDGDVIYAMAQDGHGKLLLVYRSDMNRIYTRLITSQTKYRFGRDGASQRTWNGVRCTIVSVAALPEGDYRTALGLDHKMRTANAYPDGVLSEAEIELLKQVEDHFLARPLPPR